MSSVYVIHDGESGRISQCLCIRKEAAIDAKTKREEPIKKSSELSPLSATEGRLITRGPSQSIPQQTLDEIRQLRNEARIAARERREDEKAAREEERNKAKTVVAGAPA